MHSSRNIAIFISEWKVQSIPLIFFSQKCVYYKLSENVTCKHSLYHVVGHGTVYISHAAGKDKSQQSNSTGNAQKAIQNSNHSPGLLFNEQLEDHKG